MNIYDVFVYSFQANDASQMLLVLWAHKCRAEYLPIHINYDVNVLANQIDKKYISYVTRQWLVSEYWKFLFLIS